MRSPIPDYLTQVLDTCGGDTSGAPADYIPELRDADPDRLGVSLCTVDGAVYDVGDTADEISIQSVSKPFAYALAVIDRGLEAVLQKIDVEPSGDAFNEISLDPATGRPRNPMINAGAIAAHALIDGDNLDARVERFREFAGRLAGRELTVDEAVFASEMSEAYRNRALANLLRSRGIVEGDPEDAVRGYIRQCSINVTAHDLSVMAATLAAGGVQPLTGEQVIPPRVNRQVLSVMTTCGMYDAAGDWVTSVGIPAKSGVSGVLIGALPGQVGLATFSPRLDAHGNSVRGVQIFERLSDDMGMHMMEAPQPARSVMRSRRDDADSAVFELQGSVQFPQAERMLRALVEQPITEPRAVFDLTRVFAVNDVGLRMLQEGRRRLEADGIEVIVDDPDGVYLGKADDA
ncbi:glutaminase [Naumannella cuiyingiana]|uniref:Glutaminase n=1 Tax=Naumannella cuiyingiana TaxID=1347891 RepID=A0A7Z0D7M3_9ACTN|nr:glutaminase [Naumannella cuiyingiana]